MLHTESSDDETATSKIVQKHAYTNEMNFCGLCGVSGIKRKTFCRFRGVLSDCHGLKHLG